MKESDVRDARIVDEDVEARDLLEQGFHLRGIAGVDLIGLATDPVRSESGTSCLGRNTVRFA